LRLQICSAAHNLRCARAHYGVRAINADSMSAAMSITVPLKTRAAGI
jgi:hypothetical protein